MKVRLAKVLLFGLLFSCLPAFAEPEPLPLPPAFHSVKLFELDPPAQTANTRTNGSLQYQFSDSTWHYVINGLDTTYTAGGSSAFSAVTAGTNAAALVVGTGGSLATSGSGTIDSTTLLTKTWASPAAIGTGTPAAGTFTTTTLSTGVQTFTGSSSGSAQWGVAAAAGTPARVNLPTATGSNGNCLTTDGGTPQQLSWSATCGSVISGLTTGYMPKAASATTLANSACDDGITTAGVFTCAEPIAIPASGGVSGGVIITAGTAIGHATASTVTLEAPAAVTAYEILLPAASSTGLVHCANASNVCTQTISAVNLAGADVTGTLPNASVAAAPVPSPGTSITLTAPRGYAICTGTCTISVPVPAAGYEFCAMNDDNVSTAITLSALGSSAMYENSARTAYGTAGTGTLVLSAAAANKVCIVGRDATHYLTVSYTGAVTVN